MNLIQIINSLVIFGDDIIVNNKIEYQNKLL